MLTNDQFLQAQRDAKDRLWMRRKHRYEQREMRSRAKAARDSKPSKVRKCTTR